MKTETNELRKIAKELFPDVQNRSIAFQVASTVQNTMAIHKQTRELAKHRKEDEKKTK